MRQGELVPAACVLARMLLACAPVRARRTGRLGGRLAAASALCGRRRGLVARDARADDGERVARGRVGPTVVSVTSLGTTWAPVGDNGA